MYPLSNPRTLRSEILELLNSEELETVYSSDKLEIKELLLIAPSSFLNSYYPLGYQWQIHQRSAVATDQAKESWQAQGPGIEKAIASRFAELGSDSKPQ
jgi:hypothetical protein